MRVGVLLFPLCLVLMGCGKKNGEEGEKGSGENGPVPPLENPARLARSSQCLACHEEAHAAWKNSHHALAHRDAGGSLDRLPFSGQEMTVDHARWTFSGGEEKPRIRWQDTQATKVKPVEGDPPMAIGVDPLVQYLVGTEKGRYQVPDMAWDPAEEEWFSIYGDQDRRPHEWGHWTQRGMNWNSQCAWCHFTGLRKNYQVKEDSYETEWVEQGVGCAQCHGPTREDHVEGECLVDPQQEFTTKEWTHSCATCHARREEFDEKFTTGRSFYDHYAPALPSQPGLWFADGQQLDEIYKFNSLLMSRMGHRGIGCTDCHSPHEATPIGGDLAVSSNALCMTCHGAGLNEATVIDQSAHLFHEYGTAGSRCVDCHMPKRTYMGRDPRSDHRFPIPDPLLTKETGVPNACNDCHEDKGLDWQIEWTHKWYGEDMNAVSRKRTRAIHAAQNYQADALDRLLAAAEGEEIDIWRAALLQFMDPWASDPRVVELCDEGAKTGGPLERGSAGRMIARRDDPGPLFEKLLEDPLKMVRVQTGWAGFENLPANHPVAAELAAIALHQSDQPAGAMRMARIAMAREKQDEAEAWFKRAAAWDGGSPAPRRELAVFLGGQGRTRESLRWLQDAARLAPENPEIPYLTALAHAELGDSGKARELLQKAVQLDPGFSRAWYNLGLLHAGAERLEEAVQALYNAEQTDPESAAAPYARATVHLRLNQIDAARAAAIEALRRDPNHRQAAQLLGRMGPGP